MFNPLVYSLESFIPLIKFDQSASWMPNANRSTEISIFHRQVPRGVSCAITFTVTLQPGGYLRRSGSAR